ncbi:MAG: hypothetical protein IT438_13040 [Phycisphaerales bacterium]|nr:hypothetical protein [Phycisphaerales bacterium]
MADTRPFSVSRLAYPAFAIVLWLFTTLGLGGQLGRSTDDWSFSLIDPVTGKPPPLAEFDPWSDKPYFWRPAHQVFLFFVRSYLDGYDRGIHIFVAAMHGLACLLLYRLVRSVTGSRGIAASTSLLFLACPLHHEVSLWLCTTSTAIGTALFLWLGIATARWSRGPASLRSWRELAPMSVIAAAIPFFYEQPGAAIGALPLLYLAACPTDQPVRTRLARALGSTFILGLTQIAFVCLMLATAGKGERGSAGRMVTPADLAARAGQVWHMLNDMLWGDGARIALTGSVQIGWRVATTSVAWVWLAALSLAAVACVIAAAARPHREVAEPSPTRSRAVWLALFGGLISVLAILPVAAVRGQTFPPRTLYVPILGLSLVIAAVFWFASSVLRPLWQASLPRCLGAAVVLVLTAAGGICMLGMQRVYQRSSSLDARMVASLAALAPSPPPGALFVPLSLNARAARTGMPRFDRLRPGVFETYWSAGPPLQRTLLRSDIFVSSRNPWAPNELSNPTPQQVRIAQRAMPDVPFTTREGSNILVPWDRIIPFTIEPDGDARLVNLLTFEGEDGSSLDVRPPIVTRMLEQGSITRRDTVHLNLDRAAPVPGLAPLTGWKWADGTEVLDASPIVAWRESTPPRPASWLHPTADGGRRATRTVALPPGTVPRRVVLHAALTEHDLRRLPNAHAVELGIELNGVAQPHTLVLERRDFRTSRRWKMFVVEVPSSDRPSTLSIHARSPAQSTGQDRNPLPCWVSMGNILTPPPP